MLHAVLFDHVKQFGLLLLQGYGVEAFHVFYKEARHFTSVLTAPAPHDPAKKGGRFLAY
jgi:hypothetical protein